MGRTDDLREVVDVVSNSFDVRFLWHVRYEIGEEVDHDDTVDFASAKSDVLDDMVGDVTGDVVEGTRRGVRPNYWRPGDVERVESSRIRDVREVNEHTNTVHFAYKSMPERTAYVCQSP